MAGYDLVELTEDIINAICGEQEQIEEELKLKDTTENKVMQGSRTNQISNHDKQDNKEKAPISETTFQLSAQALWNSALLQNYIHNYLKKNCATEPGEIVRLATYIGVKYDDLLTYLNMMYPYRGSMLRSEENLC